MKQTIRISLLLLALLPTLAYSQLYADLSYTHNPSCYGLCDGSASVSVGGGVAPYHFAWNPENTDTNTISNLCEGTYHVTVTDNGGSNPISFSFTLNAPSKLLGSATIVTSNCMGSEIAISATGGTMPYTGTDTFYNNPGGDYSFVVSDRNGCTDTIPVSVTYSQNLQVSAIADTACFNGTAQVTIRAIGGHAPYTGTGIFNVSGGTHYFFIQDSMGCTAIDTVVVPMYPQTVVTIAPSGVMMCSNDSVKISTTASFSSYKWNTGDTTSYIYAKAAGAYYVTITDVNQCHVESNHAEVSTFDAPTVSISQDGDTVMSYNAAAYQWYFNSQPITGATQPEYIAEQSGEYAVQITDSNGCKAMSGDVNVTVTGIKEVAETKVAAYPNPSPQGIFQLTVTAEMIGSHLEIYNSNGQIIQQSEIGQTTNSIIINSAPGMYIAAIVTPNGTFYKKLVKN